MITPLLLAGVPLASLAVVLLFGFVGCGLQTSGLASTSTFDNKLGDTPDVVSWWKLDEKAGPTAVDSKDGHNGTYASGTVVEDPVAKSSAAPGTLDFGQSSLIANEPGRTSISVNGGRVDVPFAPDLNKPMFSMGAWVRTGWTAADFAGYRCVFVSAEDDGTAFKGFALYANPSNQWEAWIGDGTAWHQATMSAPIDLGSIDFLVVTCDGTKLTLYVNVEGTASVTLGSPFQPTGSGPMRFGQATPTLFPFFGQLSDVFFCNSALTQQQINDIFLAAKSS